MKAHASFIWGERERGSLPLFWKNLVERVFVDGRKYHFLGINVA
jgi:hypothetical protein